MTKIIAECGLNWVGPDDATALGLACLDAGADYVKYQMLTDPYRTARDRGLDLYAAGAWAAQIPRMTDDEWAYVLDAIPREQRMVSVFSPNDVLTATRLRVDNLKIGHKEGRLSRLVFDYARTVFRTLGSLDSDFGGGGCVMYCVPCYPAPMDDCLHLLRTLGENYGYSDHCENVVPAHRAIQQGRPWVEIHVRPDGPGKYLDDAVSKSLAALKILCGEAHHA